MAQLDATQADTRILQAGTEAPKFTLSSSPREEIALADLRGHPFVLIFYPADWSPVCGDELALFNELVPDFRESGVTLLGISVDGVWCHRAFSEARHLAFPLLADFEPKGQVSRAYGAYRPTEGVSARALFVIDGDGVIRWSHLSPIDVNPGADGVLAALDTIRDRSVVGRTDTDAERRTHRRGVR